MAGFRRSQGRGNRGNRSIFGSVGGLRPGRSVFNLSHERKFTCDMGQLIPCLCEEVVPGDTWMDSDELVVRMGPMLAPILHEINVSVHYFFVPYRLLWPGDEVGPNTWESFITGGPSGTDTSTLPKWTVTNDGLGSLWDYLGFPIGIAGSAGWKPMAFPQWAYNFIYNEFYRDENLISKVSWATNENILYRAWEKDYFTSSRPWTQLGTPPALPFSGSAVFTSASVKAQALSNYNPLAVETQNSTSPYFDVMNQSFSGGGNAAGATNILNALNANALTAATFGPSDLRLSFQIQKWQERNARGGIRYIESLLNHFGEAPTDERMQRPEYIGGWKSPVVMSEVLQTTANLTAASGPATPGGTMYGHGLGVARQHGFKYHATEFGLVMGILSIMPRSGYSQGINRQWLRNTRYDFYWPEFAHLSEQPVYQAEIYLDTVDADNATVFGYQGRYDEMRYKPNLISAQFAKGQTYDYWHLSREFTAVPTLVQSFIECKPGKRIFADQTADNAFYINLGHRIRAVRPLPFEPTPGLLDHF